MNLLRRIRQIGGRILDARMFSGRSASFKCADCPIVMSCGLEPQEICLPREEALAGGRRRQQGMWDTGLSDRIY